MDQNQLKWITGFVWNIADDRLRDVYVRSKLKSASFPRRRESSSGETGPANLDTRIRGYDDALYGRFIVDGELLEYESGTDLRDTEQVPLKEDGGIEVFFRREVLPTLPMPGSQWMPPRSAKKSRLPATSTGPRRYTRWSKSAPASWRRSSRPRACRCYEMVDCFPTGFRSAFPICPV
ncbi:MAG: hypothetical protein Q8L97_10155 [Nitrosomonas sp.]|uniref:hypothetical protein n=1 Tax=Nitrosomonas sp. TaxID=42353 RepID=UPI0027317DF6|nr:hypothetical protein [Nitrosomonas sp.]MDP1550505.1 hypothetical protein [Nitrosomonas sp.]